MKSQTNSPANPQAVEQYLLNLQENICKALSRIDGQNFQIDIWKRPEGGGGKSGILQEGRIFEKAGVNFSHVYGKNLPASASDRRPELRGRQFEALGVSVILHPRNPYIPAAHANIRFFMALKKNHAPVWWFGGGFDLTPYYGFTEDCLHWHRTAQKACAPFGQDIYPRFKQWADAYFFIKHRSEARGVGGLFFDDLNQNDFETTFSLTQSIGDHFLKAYLPIVNKRKDLPYSKKERAFQAYRRGRYVEFNLVYDRGTLFGLQSGGRTESVLISLPPCARWQYDFKPEKNSPEEKLTDYFLKPQDWLN